MITEIIMPKAGMDMQEGQIVKWLKNKGDKVEKGDIILEILTDKVTMEVEAEVSGYLIEILYDEGETVEVITTIGYIGDELDEKLPIDKNNLCQNENKIVNKENDLEIEKTSNNTWGDRLEINGTDKKRATPAAKKLASDLGIDLNKIVGSGPRARIHKDDVIAFEKNNKIYASPLAKSMAEHESIDLGQIEGSGYKGKIMKEDVEKIIQNRELNVDNKDFQPGAKQIIELKGMRKTIAKRMTESYFSAPTFVLNMDVDMTKAKAMVEDLKVAVGDRLGEKLTMTDIISFVTAKTLKNHDMVNASLAEDGTSIIVHNHVSLAIAVAVDGGLITPVIKNAGEMSLGQIVSESKDLIKKARTNKLSASDISDSTITISNLGMYEVRDFIPIINQPNSAILGIGATMDRAIVIDGQIVIKPVMTITMTADHRVIDGAVGADFLRDLKLNLENPNRLFL